MSARYAVTIGAERYECASIAGMGRNVNSVWQTLSLNQPSIDAGAVVTICVIPIDIDAERG